MTDRKRIDLLRLLLIDDPFLYDFDLFLHLFGFAITFHNRFFDGDLLLLEAVRTEKDRGKHRAFAAAGVADGDYDVGIFGWT